MLNRSYCARTSRGAVEVDNTCPTEGRGERPTPSKRPSVNELARLPASNTGATRVPLQTEAEGNQNKP